MKNKKRTIGIGSKLIEKGQVYRVFSIKREKINGSYEKVIYYKPYYKDSINSSVVCSIPIRSIEDTLIRRPITKGEANGILKGLSKRTRAKSLDTNAAKDSLKLNDIYESARVLRRYWREKKRNKESFTKSQKDVLEVAFNRIIEEIALIYKISPTRSREKLTNALKG